MKSIALRRLGVIPTPLGKGVTRKNALVFQAELATLGYRLANPEHLQRVADSLFYEHAAIVEVLKAQRGGTVEYVPLFSNFPDEVPDDDAHFFDRVVGYLANTLPHFDEGRRLESGVVVPEWLFDLEKFGADPITQMQSRALHDAGAQKQGAREKDSHVEWIDLKLIDEAELEPQLLSYLLDLLYARSSIKAALHDDVRALLAHFGAARVELERIERREIRALCARVFWEQGELEAVKALVATPTDVLRLFAGLTDTDISLAKPVRFPKLGRAQRRLVLEILEASPALEEDLQRKRGLWLSIGRSLHVGEHRKRAPKTAAAFDKLRAGTIVTFNARSESLLREREVSALLAHLSARPGVFGRKFHEVLRRFPDQSTEVLSAFAAIMGEVPTKNLLLMRSTFEHINDSALRTVVNKAGKIKVLPNNARGALSKAQLSALRTLLDDAVLGRLREKPSWTGEKVWVDPQLSRFTVPLQQRAASDGVLSFGRGSRLPIAFDRVLRLFIYWKESAHTTDLDLSVIQFDGDFNYAGHVSYTNLSSEGIAHSGDIVSAPFGAAEFVDVSLKALPKEVRYLVPQVHRYAGEQFEQMTCHAGWMVREKVDANIASFDIKTVQNKFDLQGRAAYCLPLVVDLERREAVLVDLYMGGRVVGSNVEGSKGDVSIVCEEVSKFTFTRPDLMTLASLHVAARGGREVGEREEAERTIGGPECDHNLLSTEEVLAHWL